MTVVEVSLATATTAGSIRFVPTISSTRAGGSTFGAIAEAAAYGRSPIDVLATLPDLVMGTGSVATEALYRLLSRRATGATARVLVFHEPTYIEATQPTSESVNAIRSAFGLSVTDLAGVLGVERPTVYSWLKDQSTPSPARLDRIALVLRLADNWTATTGGGVSPSLSSPVAKGLDLLNALREPKLWEAEILENLRAQASASRAHGRGSKLVAITRDQGADPRPPFDFDIVTARPLAPEL